MKVKTFWLILLKIIGIYLVLQGVNVIIQSINTLFLLNIDSNTTYGEFVQIALVIIMTVALYVLILWLFVFKTSWLVDKLHLEKGFEEERIEINAQISNVLTIAIIVIGGIVLLNSLPQLCRQIFTFFQTKSILGEGQTAAWIFFYLVEAVSGYLLMINSRQVTNFINKHAHSSPKDENKSGVDKEQSLADPGADNNAV